MKRRHMAASGRNLLLLAVAGSATLLAACDNTPNPDFEQKYEAAQSANADDPYLRLDEVPRVQQYNWWPEKQKAATALAQAARLHGVYNDMLAQLDKEPMLPAVSELASRCREAFGQAGSYGGDARASTQDPQVLAQNLQQCRTQAIALAEAHDDKAVRAQVALFRRFSSAGMTLVALGQMGKGEVDAGLAAWRKADELFDDDKAGFQMSLKAFRGW